MEQSDVSTSYLVVIGIAIITIGLAIIPLTALIFGSPSLTIVGDSGRLVIVPSSSKGAAIRFGYTIALLGVIMTVSGFIFAYFGD